ncbi:family 16 glycosylhydrolase [Marinomonas flavescens]|uniref:family 16 glycosylhydrolase n=1 Tax=Marinomonas flavescens TaxID=2529379 RepID=UPI00140427B9|nr:family 16 glycosylhydrolase [Marinomonas flavescens]
MPIVSKRISIFVSASIAALVAASPVMAADSHKSAMPDGVGVNPDQIQGNVPNGTSSGWALVGSLSDEFNGAKVDTNKWTDSTSSAGVPWAWSPKNLAQKEGKLEITARKQPQVVNGIHVDYSSGILTSKGTQIFGYYEARVKGNPTFPGTAPAFWMNDNGRQVKAAGLVGTKEGDTTYSEIDVVEMQQDKSVNYIDMHAPYATMQHGKSVRVLTKDDPYTFQRRIDAGFDPRSDFHTYGVMVSKKALTWYLDGREVSSQPNTNWNKLPMNVKLSLGIRHPLISYHNCPQNYPIRRCPVPGAADAKGFPTTMLVDWVRVYKKKTL